MKTTVLLVRHGQSLGNLVHSFLGHTDLDLSPLGYEQAALLGDYLKDRQIDAAEASDLCRAYDTVKPLAEALSLPVHPVRELREVDVGLWEGVLRDEVERQYAEAYALYLKAPGLVRFDGGESFAEMRTRALAAVQRILSENEGKTVAIATHGGVIRALRTVWEDIPLARMGEIPQVPNASITVVRYEGERATLVTAGYSNHLTERVTERLVN